MQYSTPERMGISTESIQRYIETLEEAKLTTHSIMIARKGHIIFETYWKPFHRGFLHRLYSSTKSVTALAVGFAVQDGLLSLDDKISEYFPDEIKNQKDTNMHNQTIRQMLMMSTAKPDRGWFIDKPEDRVRYYFENEDFLDSKPGGTLFDYDSSGSFILGALVERLTKKPLMEDILEKFMDEIGVSKEAYMLKCTGGHSWCDSAMLCTAEDFLRIAQFTINYGSWHGKQLLNEDFVRAATSCQITNNLWDDNQVNSQGYGYLIWRTWRNSFYFSGMGCQFAVCTPDKDLVFVMNADNQGKSFATQAALENYFKIIVDNAKDEPLAENADAAQKLKDYCDNLVLAYAKGTKHTNTEKRINGVTYTAKENPMGIKEFRLTFYDEYGIFSYENAQGKKELKFGLCRNEFTRFPQDGYSDEVGTVAGNIRYKCAVSAAWIDEKTLYIKVQAIDKYMGILNMFFAFDDEMKSGVRMVKNAEHFFKEYSGWLSAEPK